VREAVGDLWTHPARIKVVTTNWTLKSDGSLVMGAGVAKQAAERYPDLPYELGEFIAGCIKHGRGPLPVFVARYNLISLPTKVDWRAPSELGFVEEMLDKLANDLFGTYPVSQDVVMPRPGCGLGGLRWEDVKPICERHLVSDHYIVIDKVC
jgi:hypothetical protein